MEQSDTQMISSTLHVVDGHSEKSNSISGNVGAANTDYVCHTFDEVHNAKLFCKEGPGAVNVSLANMNFKGSKMELQGCGCGQAITYKHSLSPFAATGVPSLILASQTEFGSLDPAKIDLCCLKAGSNTLNGPCQFLHDNLGVRLPRHRGFTYDQIDRKSRTFFHSTPATEHTFISAQPKLEATVSDKVGLLSATDGNAGEKNQFIIPSEANSALGVMEKLSFPPVRILPPCALLPMQRPCAQPKDECATSKIYPSGDLSNPFSEHREVNTEDLSDFYHEDTEDLEALLSSDDEDEVSSTGHSPSDLTREHSYKGVLGTSGQSESFSRKRPRESDTDVYDDACSLATIASRIHQAPSTQKASTMGTRVSYHHQSGFWQVEPVGTPKFSATPTLAISDESSSNSAANKQKRQKKSSGMQLEHLSPPLIGDSRKEKMRNIFHLLRGIFPGGESMGATFVLDQTIEYVKTLQTEVQKLQAQKFIRR